MQKKEEDKEEEEETENEMKKKKDNVEVKMINTDIEKEDRKGWGRRGEL